MAFRLLGTHLSPAEGEQTVRTYHCTSLSSRLLGLKAEGYLTVTNKRVVFYALGTSYSGESILQSEVPIADVSGINSYKGNYFRWLHVLGALLVCAMISSFVSTVVAGLVVTLIVEALDLGAPQTIVWILAFATIVASFFMDRERLRRSVLAATATMLFGWASFVSAGASIVRRLSGGGTGMEALGAILGVFTFVYLLVCLYWYGCGETMSLNIGSKGGGSSPISIAGAGALGRANSAAARALTAEPARDAEAMIKELGAMITDIQALGDFGIAKWTRP